MLEHYPPASLSAASSTCAAPKAANSCKLYRDENMPIEQVASRSVAYPLPAMLGAWMPTTLADNAYNL